MRKRHLFFLLYSVSVLPGRAVADINQSFIEQLPECSQECLRLNHTITASNACDNESYVQNAIYSCTDTAYCGDWNQDSTNKNWLVKNNMNNAACGGKEITTLSTSSISQTTSTLSTTSSSSTSVTSSSTITPTTSPLKDLASSTSSPTALHASSSQKLSTGAIVGIVVGSLSFLLILGALVFLILRNRRQHRRQVGSMVLEQNPPSGPGHNEMWKPMTSNSGWVTVDSTSSTPTFQPNASAWPLVGSNDRSTTPPVSNSATRRLAPITIIDQDTPGFAVSEPVSPPTAGIGHRGPISDQLTGYPFPPPIPNDEPLSPVSPVSTRKGRESAASSMVSMDNFVGPSAVAHEDFAAQERRHTCSAPAARLQNDSRRISAGSTGSLARAESVAWRKEVEEAAQRATNRVVMSEQAAAQSEDGIRNERGSKGSAIPGLERLTRKRWSKESQDSDFHVGTPPSGKNQGFLSRKRVSDGSGKGVFIV